jgi:signal transduction histidine kinase
MGWRHSKERYWSSLTPLKRDAVGALLLSAAMLTEVLSADLAGPVGAVLAQSLVITGATALRRRAPLLAVAVAAVAGAANAVIYSGSDFDFLVTQVWAVILLAYSVAAYAHRRTWAAAGFLLLLCSFWVDNARQDSAPGDYLASLVAVAAPWLAGWAVRQARRQAQTLQEANRQLDEQNRHAELAAAAAERLRIARELHDIVAHWLTVVALQADAADALLPAACRGRAAGLLSRSEPPRTTRWKRCGDCSALCGRPRMCPRRHAGADSRTWRRWSPRHASAHRFR